MGEIGFEIYAWAASRPELNDWPERGDKSVSYTRAVYNLKSPSTSQFSNIQVAIREKIGGQLSSDTLSNIVAYGSILKEAAKLALFFNIKVLCIISQDF